MRVPAAADSYGFAHSSSDISTPQPAGEAAAVAGVKPTAPAGLIPADQIADVWGGLSRDSRVVMVGDYQMLSGTPVCVSGLQVRLSV